MGAPRRAAAPLARAGGRGLSPRGCQWHPKEGAGSEETVSEVHEEHVPGAPRRRGTARPGAAAELPAGGLWLRWITSCVEERGLGEGAEGGDGVGWGGGSLHSICSCNTSVTSHLAVGVAAHPPPTDASN